MEKIHDAVKRTQTLLDDLQRQWAEPGHSPRFVFELLLKFLANYLATADEVVRLRLLRLFTARSLFQFGNDICLLILALYYYLLFMLILAAIKVSHLLGRLLALVVGNSRK
jgi:hypothetical protein